MFKPQLSSGSSKIVDVDCVQKYTIVCVLALVSKCF